jgi:N-acetyl-gamma-glutamyl-phosphate reductase
MNGSEEKEDINPFPDDDSYQERKMEVIKTDIKKKIKVGIIGHTGRLGKPLVAILNEHPYAKIVYTESRKEGKNGNLSEADLIFLALPYGESKNYISKLDGKKIIDLSIDHRNNDGWIYGLPELNKERIKNAKKIANPGCYATSIILGLAPLKGKLEEVNISSTCGISGAGMTVQENDNFMVYNEGKVHPHISEIEKMLETKDIWFVPQQIDNTDRGMISTIFCKHKNNENLIGLYKEFYKKEPFIRIKENIKTKNLIGTNYCDIKILKFENKTLIISALDNLIRGGAGQAIQNFNLMYGFDETTGLL